MEEIVEKNDVDISKIFNWGRVFEVVGQGGEVSAVVYMRLLGDADLNRARTYAVRKSAELRRKLKDINSDERIAYVKDIDDLEVSDIVGLIQLFSMREISNEARKNVKIKNPKPPKTEAPLEELEKFQKEVDTYSERYAEAVSVAINKELEKLKKSLEKQGKEELYKQYVKLIVDDMCEREAFSAFRDMQTYLACYKDDTYKERFFSDFDEFDNLEPNTKADFRDAFDKIDVGMNELKKLRQATQ